MPYEKFTFNGGELQVKLKPANFEYRPEKGASFKAHVTSSDNLIELALVVDAVERYFDYKLAFKELILPYMPYARQDRVCAEGEALSLAVAAKFINSLEFDKVVVVDPHSDVTAALLNNCVVTTVEDIFNSWYPTLLRQPQIDYLVSPDNGANKKVHKIAQQHKLPVIHAGKNRDVQTGRITETVLYDTYESDVNLLVVDDICDGGATFIELGKVLKRARSLNLYVTHGIFSKGLAPLLEYYEKIYCPFVFPAVDTEQYRQQGRFIHL